MEEEPSNPSLLVIEFPKAESKNFVFGLNPYLTNKLFGSNEFVKSGTHFSHEGPGKGELSFRKGEVFHVVDTLYNGKPGSWLVFRLGRNGQEFQRGIIPNSSRAKELAQMQQTSSKKEGDGESRGNFFRRRARRSKSLCKDHWEDVVLDCIDLH
ncbi:UNVERIFIED_CONTAM: Tjp1 [Trichonephila clavipes]